MDCGPMYRHDSQALRQRVRYQRLAKQLVYKSQEYRCSALVVLRKILAFVPWAVVSHSRCWQKSLTMCIVHWRQDHFVVVCYKNRRKWLRCLCGRPRERIICDLRKMILRKLDKHINRRRGEGSSTTIRAYSPVLRAAAMP